LWRGHDNQAIRKYQIIGAGRRKCDCFACGSSDRDRLVHEFLKNEISDFSCMKILHVAPERQLNKKLTSLGAKMINIDARKSGYKFAYGSETITADLTCLPFESETFDWVIANHVLEHIIDEKRALSEINRVLKPQGKAILMIPYYGLDFLESWTETFEIVRLIEVDAPQELNVLIGEKIILVEK
jgi:ubiquinone/menaquinone biosynthesis C-methylase UbiE